jgi:actin-related protein
MNLMLRGLEAHKYQLEDPVVSEQFFHELQDLMLNDDLKDLDPKILREHYPWLATKSYNTSREDLFTHYLFEKKKKVKARIVSPIRGEKKKSISQMRFEKDLADKEEKLKLCLQTNFHAKPVPASTLLPKYSKIMESQGTRANEIRVKSIENSRTKMEEAIKSKQSQKVNPILFKALGKMSKKYPKLQNDIIKDIQARRAKSISISNIY